jgi:hypothetical protein
MGNTPDEILADAGPILDDIGTVLEGLGAISPTTPLIGAIMQGIAAIFTELQSTLQGSSASTPSANTPAGS